MKHESSMDLAIVGRCVEHIERVLRDSKAWPGGTKPTPDDVGGILLQVADALERLKNVHEREGEPLERPAGLAGSISDVLIARATQQAVEQIQLATANAIEAIRRARKSRRP